MAENWWLILLVVVVLGVGIWWLAGGRTPDRPPTVDRCAADRETDALPDTPRERIQPTATTLEPAVEPPAPVVIGSAASPMDVAPPPIPVADDARVVDAAPAPSGAPDDLTVLKGIGPKLAATLADLGVTRFDQIARWSDADLARVDDRLGGFKGRPTRDRWIEQAQLLASGDRPGFEAKFGRIEG